MILLNIIIINCFAGIFWFIEHHINFTDLLQSQFFLILLTSAATGIFTYGYARRRDNKINRNKTESILRSVYMDFRSMLNALERIHDSVIEIEEDGGKSKICVKYTPYSGNILALFPEIILHPNLLKISKESRSYLRFIENAILLQNMWRECNDLLDSYNQNLNIENIRLNDNALFHNALNVSFSSLKAWLDKYLNGFGKQTCAFAIEVNKVIPILNLPERLPDKKSEKEIFNSLTDVSQVY